MTAGRWSGVSALVLLGACGSSGAIGSRSPNEESAAPAHVAGSASVATPDTDDAPRMMAGGSSANTEPRGGVGASGGGGASAGRGAADNRAGHGGSAAAGSGGKAAAAGSSASAPKGKLYGDAFESGSLTMPSWIDADPDLGGQWMIVAADGGSKALAQTADVSDWVIAAGGDYRWTDQVVEARVRITSDPGKAGIFARLSDTRNYYFLYIDGGSNLVLRKRVDNSSDDVQKVKLETQANTWYTLKLSVIGSQIQGYLDGKMMVSGSDGSLTMGGIGVGTSDCTAEFDDVVVNGS